MTDELLVESSPRVRLRQGLTDLWQHRSTVLAFAERDVRVKYKQAVLGVGWAVLQPLAFMVVFTVALGRLAQVPGGGVPYAVFSLSALVPWALVQNTMSAGGNALISDAALLRKVYFPREIPVLGAALAAWVDFGIGLCLFVLLGPLLGARLSVTWLLAPVLGVGLAALAAGAALAIAGLNVYYRDFRYALPFFLQLWLFASPVAYPLTVIPAQWRVAYAFVNPAAGWLDGFRRVLALGQLPAPELIGASLVGTCVLVLGGYRLFKTLEPNFADVV